MFTTLPFPPISDFNNFRVSYLFMEKTKNRFFLSVSGFRVPSSSEVGLGDITM